MPTIAVFFMHQLFIHLRKSVWCICFIFMMNSPKAQENLQFRQFNSENGLSENAATCVFQDSKGFLWIGTYHGLNRFDGFTFKKYYSNNYDSTSLSGNEINCIGEAAENQLWVGTENGLNILNVSDSKVKRISLPGYQFQYTVNNLFVINKDSLLVHIDPADFYIYTPAQNKWVKILTDIPVGKNVQSFQITSARESIAVTSDSGLMMYDKNTNRFRKNSLPVFPGIKANSLIKYYFRDAEGYDYIQVGTTLFIFNNRQQLITSMVIDKNLPGIKNTISGIIASVNGKVYIAISTELYFFDKNKSKLSLLKVSDQSGAAKLIRNIGDIMVDRDENLWVASFGDGLLQTDIKKKVFSSILNEQINPGSVNSMIYGLYQWPGNILAVENNYFKFSLLQQNKPVGYKDFAKSDVAGILKTTCNKQLFELTMQQQQIVKRMADSGMLIPYKFILHDSATVIYFHKGLVVFNNNTTVTLSKEHINYTLNGENEYWVASRGGLGCLNKKNLRYVNRVNNPQNASSISENYIYYILKIGMDSLMIATKGGGINIYDKKKNSFSAFTVKNGLPDDVVYFILPDNRGNYWLSTNSGISRFNLAERSFSNYTQRNGLLNTEYNCIGGLMLSDSTFYFSGTKGIDFFKPGEVEKAGVIPQLAVAGIWVNGNEIPIQPVIKLSFLQSNVSIAFSANDFKMPDLVYYRYRIMETSGEWFRIQGRNELNLYSLLPGKYTVELQSSYNNIVWSESGSVTLIISPPWWKQLWFKVLIALLFVITVSWLIKMYINNKVYKKKVLYEKQLGIIKERERIISDLHDDVGATLSSIHIYGNLADKVWNTQPETSRKMLGNIIKQAKELMMQMGDIIWSMKPAVDEKNNFEDRLKNYASELLSPQEITCNFKIDETVSARIVNPLARKNLLLIVKEAMNNISKYSEANHVEISLYQSGQTIILTIHDNGKGFVPLKTLNGNGLGNMKQRCEQLNGTFKIESIADAGLTITCSFPIAIFSHTA